MEWAAKTPFVSLVTALTWRVLWLVPNIIFGWHYDTNVLSNVLAYWHWDKPGAVYFLVGMLHFFSPACHNPLSPNGYLSLATWSQVHPCRGEQKPTCRLVLSQLCYDLAAVLVITKWLWLHHQLHKSWFIAFGEILNWRCTFLKLLIPVNFQHAFSVMKMKWQTCVGILRAVLDYSSNLVMCLRIIPLIS